MENPYHATLGRRLQAIADAWKEFGRQLVKRVRSIQARVDQAVIDNAPKANKGGPIRTRNGMPTRRGKGKW